MVSIHDISQEERNTSVTMTRESGYNPWYNVNNLVQPHQAQASDGLFQTWPQFGRLPLDLIPYIVTLMPKESAAALAVTSKQMYSIIGPRVLRRLNPAEKWRLMLLLERDADLMMACGQCNMLHAPIMTPAPYQWNSCSGGAQCVRETTTDRSHLPKGITPVLCRLLAKRYLRQQSYGDILSMAAKSFFLTLPDFKVFNTMALRIVNGNLLLRNQIFMAPMAKGTKTASGRAAYALDKLICKRSTGLGDFRCCQHLGWNDAGLQIADSPYSRYDDDYDAPKQLFEHIEGFATGHQEEHHQDSFWGGEKHPSMCYGRDTVDEKVFNDALSPSLRCALLHAQPCMTCEAVGTVNLVNSCSECYTDFCASAQDVEGIGRVMVLTTWKDLGGVMKSDNGPDKWWSHQGPARSFGAARGSPRLPTVAPRFLCEPCGSIFTRYEGNEHPPTPHHDCKEHQSKMRKLKAVSPDIMHSGCAYHPTLGRRVTALFERNTDAQDDDRWWHSLS